MLWSLRYRMLLSVFNGFCRQSMPISTDTRYPDLAAYHPTIRELEKGKSKTPKSPINTRTLLHVYNPWKIGLFDFLIPNPGCRSSPSHHPADARNRRRFQGADGFFVSRWTGSRLPGTLLAGVSRPALQITGRLRPSVSSGSWGPTCRSFPPVFHGPGSCCDCSTMAPAIS